MFCICSSAYGGCYGFNAKFTIDIEHHTTWIIQAEFIYSLMLLQNVKLCDVGPLHFHANEFE